MDQAIKVYVSPANNNSSFLDSVSTQSCGLENICDKDAGMVDVEEEEFEKEILKASEMLESDTKEDEVNDAVFSAAETTMNENVSTQNIANSTKPKSAPLVNVTRTLRLARSWLNRSRASSAERTAPRVDSFLEKLEMAGPSHVTRSNNHMFDSAYSSKIVDPSRAFHYYWLVVVTVCVLYNWIFIIARTAFADLQNRTLALWLVLDYVSDLIYILDMVIQLNTGEWPLRFQIFI